MALSIFEDKIKKPYDEDIREALGSSCRLWEEIKEYMAGNPGAMLEEWKYYGKSSGWTLLLKQKKRTIIYMFPGKDFFTTLFVFGEKAMEQAGESNLPHYIIERINSAKPYMEGRSFQVEVKSEQDLENVKILMDIKLNN